MVEAKEDNSEENIYRSDMKATAEDYHPRTFHTPVFEYEQYEELAALPKPYFKTTNTPFEEQINTFQTESQEFRPRY